MSKKNKNIDKNHIQLNIFDILRQSKTITPYPKIEGELDVSIQLRRALSAGLKQSPLSRHQVAGEMSHKTGKTITITTIDSWTAESKQQNRIPAEYIPAFCVVTGFFEPLRIITAASGQYVMPGPDALRGEIQRWREQLKKARAEVVKRERLLNGLIELENR